MVTWPTRPAGVAVAALSIALSAAIPMHAMEFALGGTDVRAPDASWIQATGEIDEDTLKGFIAFAETEDWYPKRIRFDSPGGNLGAAMALGRELRARGFATEIGNHEDDPEFDHLPYWDMTKRAPGNCASACANAFMGGVERRIDPGSALGLHQFYVPADRSGTDPAGPALVPVGNEQALAAQVLSYVLEMGVDARVFVRASKAGPKEMVWIDAGEEAAAAGLTYEPAAWSVWAVDTLGAGLVARSARADRASRLMVFCSDGTGFADLTIRDETLLDGWSLRGWVVDQCLAQGSFSEGTGAHRILGNRVDATATEVIDGPGEFTLRFNLGRTPVISDDPSFLFDDYPMACKTDRFIGSRQNLLAAVRMAFTNCIR